MIGYLRSVCEYHYDVLMVRSEFLHHVIKLHEALSNASRCFNKIASKPSGYPRLRSLKANDNRELKRHVGDAYSHYAELEESRLECLKGAQLTSVIFERSTLLRSHAKYTHQIIEDVEEWRGQHLLENLRFLADESRNQGLQSAAFNGPLLGALIALVATALVLLLN